MLWLFGPTIEDRQGHGGYLAFYLACGLAASVAHVAFNPGSTAPALLTNSEINLSVHLLHQRARQA
jgi:membrane associated rhomboid family serine protease